MVDSTRFVLINKIDYDSKIISNIHFNKFIKMNVVIQLKLLIEDLT